MRARAVSVCLCLSLSINPVSGVCGLFFSSLVSSVWDFDYSSGKLSTESVNDLVRFIKEKGYTVEWILDTHMHAGMRDRRNAVGVDLFELTTNKRRRT